MDERKQRILQAIIQDYIKSAEPVGSRTIARNYDLGISPATVRNEMYDLEQLGFLEQPHTSAGRIPSAKGYRFYVDQALAASRPEREDAEQIDTLWQTQPTSFDEFFLNVAKLISQISHNMSMFLAPAHDTSTLKFIHVLPLDSRKAVMVIITDSGALDNEPVYFEEAYREDDVAAATVKLNHALHDRFLRELDREKLAAVVAVMDGPRSILIVLTEALFRAISKRKFFYSVGTKELLGQPEFRNVEKVQSVLYLLEEQDQLSRLLSDTSGHQIKIKIGGENQDEAMQEISLIQADFAADKEQHIGTLAILGPTRMEYGRIIGLLSYMQHFIRQLEPPAPGNAGRANKHKPDQTDKK